MKYVECCTPGGSLKYMHLTRHGLARRSLNAPGWKPRQSNSRHAHLVKVTLIKYVTKPDLYSPLQSMSPGASGLHRVIPVDDV